VEIIVPFSCPNRIPFDHNAMKGKKSLKRERRGDFCGFISKFLKGHDEFLHVKMQAFFLSSPSSSSNISRHIPSLNS